MSEQTQFPKPLPIDERVVVKTSGFYIGSTFFPNYNSTKQLLNKIKEILYKEVPRGFYLDGMGAETLEPGNEWVSGKLRLDLILEFVPDKPNNIVNEFVSPLDDIRTQL